MGASAEAFTYMNFVRSDGSVAQFAATGMKMTFSGKNIMVTNGSSTGTVPMAGLKHLVFGNQPVDPTVKGDVNGDGTVDITDVNALVNLLLTGNSAGCKNPDVNGDGNIDVSDINAVIGIITSA